MGVLRRAVEIAPFNLVAWGYLGLGLGIAGDGDEVDEGRRILDRLLETTPDHPSLPYWLYFKGGVLTRQGRFEEAAACAGRTVELQPHFFLAAVMLANALGSLGRPEEAHQQVLVAGHDDVRGGRQRGREDNVVVPVSTGGPRQRHWLDASADVTMLWGTWPWQVFAGVTVMSPVRRGQM